MRKLKIFSDGCSRGNPGLAGIGYVILDMDNRIIVERAKFIGVRTNNEAEYIAAIEALKEALSLDADEVELYSDSKLLVKQLRGEYRVRNPRLKQLHKLLSTIASRFRLFRIEHIRRIENMHADKLAKAAASQGEE